MNRFPPVVARIALGQVAAVTGGYCALLLSRKLFEGVPLIPAWIPFVWEAGWLAYLIPILWCVAAMKLTEEADPESEVRFGVIVSGVVLTFVLGCFFAYTALRPLPAWFL